MGIGQADLPYDRPDQTFFLNREGLGFFLSCHTPIFDLRLYSGGVSLINRGT